MFTAAAYMCVMLCEGLFKLSVCLLSKWVFKDDFHIPTACLLSFSNLIALRIAHFSHPPGAPNKKVEGNRKKLFSILLSRVIKKMLKIVYYW